MHEFQVIVGETYSSESDRRDHSHPHIDTRQPGPQKCRDNHRRDNQQSSHRRRVALRDVGLRPFFSDLLADIPSLHRIDDATPKQQSY